MAICIYVCVYVIVIVLASPPRQGMPSKRRVSTEGRYARGKSCTVPTTRICRFSSPTWRGRCTFRWRRWRRESWNHTYDTYTYMILYAILQVFTYIAIMTNCCVGCILFKRGVAIRKIVLSPRVCVYIHLISLIMLHGNCNCCAYLHERRVVIRKRSRCISGRCTSERLCSGQPTRTLPPRWSS